MSKNNFIEKALECKGWTSKEKLNLIFDLIQKIEHLNGDILEIGSAWGRSTVLIALSSNKKVWSIDPHTGGIVAISEKKPQNSFDEFCTNLEKNFILDKVNILKYTTKEVYEKKLLPNTLNFSFIFIDGLHTAEAVALDFKLAYSKLIKNGILVFDDYFEKSIPEYTKMIDKISKELNIELIKEFNSKLVYLIKYT
ncbi:class I SAM-dependent methyltransferase [Arcobacter sp.]|uniref:class I SAM-dependent methyltransferase n=1 Tax=unclassified Arcobacter TaxID=2593671 RepID=UPI003B005548